MNIYEDFLSVNLNIKKLNEKIIKITEENTKNIEVLRYKINKEFKRSITTSNNITIKINKDKQAEHLKINENRLALEFSFIYKNYTFYFINVFEKDGIISKNIESEINVRYHKAIYAPDKNNPTFKIHSDEERLFLTKDYLYIEKELFFGRNYKTSFSINFNDKNISIYSFMIDNVELEDDHSFCNYFLENYEKMVDYYILSKPITQEEIDIYNIQGDLTLPALIDSNFNNLFMIEILEKNTIKNKIKNLISKV